MLRNAKSFGTILAIAAAIAAGPALAATTGSATWQNDLTAIAPADREIGGFQPTCSSEQDLAARRTKSTRWLK